MQSPIHARGNEEMGLGDDLLAAGQAKLLGRTVKIGDGSSVWEKNPLFDYIPYIDINADEWFLDHAGKRGYTKTIDRKRERIMVDGKCVKVKMSDKIRFNMDYRAEPAIIELEPIENDYVIVEPHIKPGAPPGKQWNYFDKVRDCGIRFLQFNSDSFGCERVDATIVEAARWMAGSRGYFGTEGFLHHLAAAFGKPAVVMMGAYNHPSVVGYDFHTNIWRDVPEELGHQQKFGAMDTIPPEEVLEALHANY